MTKIRIRRDIYDSINKKFSIKVIVCILLILSLIILRDIVHLNISKLLFLAIFSIFFITMSSGEIIELIVFIIPLINGLPGNLILILSIITLISKKDFNLNMKKILIPFLILFFELLYMYIYNQSIEVLINIFRHVTFITVISIIIFDNKLELNYYRLLRIFTLSVISMCIIIFFTTLEYYPIETILNGNFRYGDLSRVSQIEGMVLSNNQNNIGYYCTLNITVLLILNYIKPQMLVFNLFCIIVTFGFGLLTMSRAFILCSISAILFYYLFSIKNVLMGIKNILYLIILLYVGIQIFNYIMPGMVDSVFNRLTNSDNFGGRSQIYASYNEFLTRNMNYILFGMGLFNISKITGIEIPPHNSLQQIFLSYGIIGISIFIIFIYFFIRGSRYTNKRIPIIAYMPIAYILIYTQSIQLLNPFELMLPFIIAWATINFFQNEY